MDSNYEIDLKHFETTSNYEIDVKHFETTYDVLNITYTLKLRLATLDYGTGRKFYDWRLTTDQIILDDNHIFKLTCRECCKLSDDAKSMVLGEIVELNDVTTDLFELIMLPDQELVKRGNCPKEMSINEYRSLLIDEINNLWD